MDTKLDVPLQFRELVLAGIDNTETALALFFDAVTTSSPPASADSLGLFRRVIAVKFDYARKVALAKDLTEATALQFAYCRSQVDITLDLIRIISDHNDKLSDARP